MLQLGLYLIFTEVESLPDWTDKLSQTAVLLKNRSAPSRRTYIGSHVFSHVTSALAHVPSPSQSLHHHRGGGSRRRAHLLGDVLEHFRRQCDLLAKDGVEGLEAVKNNDPNLIITDLQMPRIWFRVIKRDSRFES
jgi:hypothetical protein